MTITSSIAAAPARARRLAAWGLLVVAALPASVCLSPYVLFHSYSAALIALTRNAAAMIAAVVGLWIVVALRALAY